jgi:hypothetical protein
MEHEACIFGLWNNGHLNRALELTGVAYGPRPTPVSVEVLKKRKEDATEKSANTSKGTWKEMCGGYEGCRSGWKRIAETTNVDVEPEKKRMETAKVVVVPKKRRTETTEAVMV